MNDDVTEYSFLVTRASEYKNVGETLPSTIHQLQFDIQKSWLKEMLYI